MDSALLPTPQPGRTILIQIKNVSSDPLSATTESGGFFKYFLLLLAVYFFIRMIAYTPLEEESQTSKVASPKTHFTKRVSHH
jgi:hypothetical protein